MVLTLGQEILLLQEAKRQWFRSGGISRVLEITPRHAVSLRIAEAEEGADSLKRHLGSDSLMLSEWAAACPRAAGRGLI